jgi:hypothetical protein
MEIYKHSARHVGKRKSSLPGLNWLSLLLSSGKSIEQILKESAEQKKFNPKMGLWKKFPFTFLPITNIGHI